MRGKSTWSLIPERPLQMADRTVKHVALKCVALIKDVAGDLGLATSFSGLNAAGLGDSFLMIAAVVASNVISGWDDDLKTQFIAGHPRIGEVNGLSQLSAQEQAAKATPPEVLARLAHLNTCYENHYPGLIYITFVNGRSRAQIM